MTSANHEPLSEVLPLSVPSEQISGAEKSAPVVKSSHLSLKKMNPKSKVPKFVATGSEKQGKALPVSTALKKKIASWVLPKDAKK